ncbi:MAG: endonuclease/exonuclease/phosphatase family protein [Planctomycetota bacterium]|jgi:endonuclease/exonuclease/phosphatase family metal-dependent hydrolase
MRLLTWNIHKGIGGVDRRYSPGRIAAVLRHYNADVVLLQEVDDGVPRSGRDRQVDLLGDVLDYAHRSFAPNVRLKHGCYGNALLSHFPIVRHSNINLTFPMKKRRGALLTVLDAHVGSHRYTLHVVNVHLGLSGVERRWQVRRLLRSSALTALDRSSRIVVAGDMNDWSGILAGGMLRRTGFQCATGVGVRASRTFPAWGPVGPLDRVFLRGGLRCTHHFRSRLALARQASDHLPVIAELKLLPR